MNADSTVTITASVKGSAAAFAVNFTKGSAEKAVADSGKRRAAIFGEVAVRSSMADSKAVTDADKC